MIDVMGLTNSLIVLSNPRKPELQPIEVIALADTGAVHMCIPKHVAIQLAFEESELREVTLADGNKKTIPYVRPLKIQNKGRTCYTGALVLGDEPLIGAIPMEDMDLIVIPGTRELAVNPKSPNIPTSVAKGLNRRLNNHSITPSSSSQRIACL